MDSAKLTTHCLACGDPVLLSAVISSLGQCANCYQQFVAAQPADIFRVPKEVLIRSHFFPGFAVDLTSWTTDFNVDGTVHQTIRWHEQSHGRRPAESRKAKVCDERLLELIAAIQSIDRLGISQINKRLCIDDAAIVHISTPEYGFQASILLYSLVTYAVGQQITAPMRNGLMTFKLAWEMIESVAPYTTAVHWKS